MKNENYKLQMAVWLCAGALALSCGRGKVEETARTGHAGHEEEAHERKDVELSKEALASLQIKTARAERRAVGAVIHATAVIKLNADRVAHVTPRIPGRVAQSFITLGQRVRKGERLMALDSVELGEAKSAFRKAKARLEVTKSGYERERRLYEDGRIVSEKEMLEARGAYLEAKAEFEAAEERLHLYGLSQEEIDRIGAGHDPQASLFPVVSPLSGTVIEKHLTLGEVVRPEEAVCTVADLSTLWIVLNVYEKDVARVRVGQEATVRVDAYPGRTFHGTLTYVGAALDEATRTAGARVEVDNASGELKPGMFAEATVIEGDPATARQALVIPASALQRVGGAFVVFVREGETRFERRDVVAGEEVGGEVEVVSGLKEGEEVVAEGSFVLKSELLKDQMEGHED
ncbi:MAG: hypothetical protein A3F84_11110 [Candidatus Handelsmanbacteria bacterium RIFCSPLOWO2_12_FULL_64_10]|uniref:RND efflux pump membrane fusion protein barrel-sandwich domain-containing protein n=1 Tax=Handelsmanbacteria sp. (strain RIFCSPLOWO2_12_FULL_64_10) TaxID=1817868 RepID=A0A1F6D1G0_HANXR|nr:MAG: hypothetical protein A3F84_11110 [Candidatus Handelsmanbacteria bacterium RIFCSPLOWO2_12_FULL_64_10]